jgi:dihydrofolate synthase / folylpolyglutamate synthase
MATHTSFDAMGEENIGAIMTVAAEEPTWCRIRAKYEARPIQLGLDRVQTVLASMGLAHPKPVVIAVAGTNGKGSTCAMLESVLLAAGFRTGCYTSPHLVSFQERIRLVGEQVGDAMLDAAFAAVEQADVHDVLTAFEVDTVAALWCFQQQQLDALVLEVGMGGRLDAVNAVDADCAVICSIALDHTEFLGDNREAIGREKAGIMRAGRPVVVSDPQPPASLQARATELGADLRQLGVDFNFQGDKQQWGWRGRSTRFNGLAYPALRGANQLLNAAGVLAVFEALRDRLPINAQAVRNGLALVELPGRFQIVPGQPTLVLDVAHNPQSVAALALNLDQMGFYPATHAVFGAMRDKDLATLLPHLAPLVDHWHLTDLPTPRAAHAADLAALVQVASAGRSVTIHTHASPDAALKAAAAAADPADRIVVFGSFFTVGGVLKDGLPRLAARHLG